MLLTVNNFFNDLVSIQLLGLHPANNQHEKVLNEQQTEDLLGKKESHRNATQVSYVNNHDEQSILPAQIIPQLMNQIVVIA